MRRALRLIVFLVVVAMAVSVVAIARAGSPAEEEAHLAYVGSPDPVKANYGQGNYVFDTVEFSGSKMAGPSILSVGDLERLATDVSSGLGYANTYSLLTSGAEFSKSRFSGVKLYDLLVHLGLDAAAPPSTPVRVYAADGYCVTLTLAMVQESARYDCYAAKGDATVEQAELPVLLSYAAGGLPLVGPTGDDPVARVFTADEGYDATADNGGGPIRLTIGQTSVDDFNARLNAKWVSRVVVGDATDATHTGAYAGLATSTLGIEIRDSADPVDPLRTETFTVGELEGLSPSVRKGNYYDDGVGAHYQGIDLWKFLGAVLDLPAYEGTVTFTSGSGESASVDLSYLRNPAGLYAAYTVTRTAALLDDSHADLAITGVRPLLAFAKNGYPLVADEDDDGYVPTAAAGVVDNDGGPLAVLLPRDGTHLSDPVFLPDVTGITLSLDIPKDLHTGETYGDLASHEVAFAGNGFDAATTLTVADFEQEFSLMVTHDYGDVPAATGCMECHPDATSDSPTNCLTCHSLASMLVVHGTMPRCVELGPTGSYHGIDLLRLLRAQGLTVDAWYVAVTGSDGTSATYSLDDLETTDTPVLLAFSRSGVPLVESLASAGYDAAAGNAGGPIMLVSKIQTVADVVSVSVSTKYGVWTHDRAPYAAYLPWALTISGSEADGNTVLSLDELERLPSVRDSFAASKGNDAYQGVALRDLLAGRLAAGVSRPSRITVHGADGYSASLDVDAVLGGIDSTYQPGEHRDVILAYAKNGFPLVTSVSSEGYMADARNDDGPIHLVVENSISAWVKGVRAIVVGDGEPVFAPDRVPARAVRIVAPTPSQRGGHMARGSRLSLGAIMTPSHSTDTLTWSSSRASRASVSAKGVVTAKRYGATVITVKTASGQTDRYTVRVTRLRPATRVVLPRERSLRVGRWTRLVAKVTPVGSTSVLAWRSSDRSVATVGRDGRVVAKRRGVVTIRVSTTNGRRSSCRLTVLP